MFGILNSALLWALAAVGVPLLIHFLTRRKLRVVTISTIAFLKRLEKEKIRQLKLRQWLLLLLRMAIVALLVLAFARPTLRREHAALAQRARATAVFIVDNSMSMAASPEGTSLLEQARRHGEAIAELFRPGDELYIITAAEPAALFSGSPFLEKEKLVEALGELPQSWAETDLSGAFAMARDILSQSHNVNRELYLLSDCRTADLPALPALPGVRGYALRYDSALRNNLTLVDISLANQIFEKGESFEVIATVANAGERDFNNQLVHLYLNSKRVAQQSVEVPAGSSRQVTLRAIPDSAGFLTGRVSLDDDDLMQDNTRYFSFYIPRQRRLLAVAEQPEDLLYVRAVLQMEAANGGTTQSWKEITTRALSAESFSEYDGIILVNVSRFPEGVASRLINFLASGGGLIVFPGNDTDLRDYNEALFVPLDFGGWGGTMGSLNTLDNFIKLGAIDFSHPLFSGVFEKSDKEVRIESPQFRFAVQLNLGPHTKAVLNYANGLPFLAERQVQSGKILVFTSAPDERWSDFSFKGLFAPLVYRSVAYVTQNNENQQQTFLVGSELNTLLRVPAQNVEVSLPNNERVKAPVNVVGQNYQVQVPATALPGFYSLWNAGERAQVWPVNFNAEELQVAPLTEEKLAAGSGAAAWVELSAHDDLAAGIQQMRYGAELWHWFLGAALIAMIVEMLLARGAAANTNSTAAEAAPRMRTHAQVN